MPTGITEEEAAEKFLQSEKRGRVGGAVSFANFIAITLFVLR
jgi:hypothetical protein